MSDDKPLTITRTIEVAIADANGKPIRVGSVLRNVTALTPSAGSRGVVVQIPMPGDWVDNSAQFGDLIIKTGAGSDRITNIYNEWIHIERAQQTVRERYLSWKVTPFDRNSVPEGVKPETWLSIEGIFALLPEEPREWDDVESPFTTDEALGILVSYIEEGKL